MIFCSARNYPLSETGPWMSKDGDGKCEHDVQWYRFKGEKRERGGKREGKGKGKDGYRYGGH